MLTVTNNASLKLYSTMRLGGVAKHVATIRSKADLTEALAFAKQHSLPTRVIGHGSNIIWSDDGFDGLLLVNAITGFEKVSDTTVKIGSGEEWDKAVQKTVDLGLYGLELLSLIPGTVGATPVQNVGAYGSEVKDTIASVEVYDTTTESFYSIANEDCAFGYRTSRFKTTDTGRFIILSVTFTLTKQAPQPPFYESLQVYLDQNSITDYSAQNLRSAVIAVRTSKMPDPKVVANNGSFFANPIIPTEQFTSLQAQFPDIKGWDVGDNNTKVAAGWLVQNAGFNDFHDPATGMATWHSQNLVLVNEHATTTKQLLDFKQKITDAVQNKFGITLQAEPELL